MVTLHDIAKQADVSIGTVSRVLNSKNKELWKSTSKRAAKIRRIAKKLEYRPRSAARSMRSQRTYQVGVLLRNAPDRPMHYLPEFEFILGINQFLEPINYVLSVVRIEDVPTNGRHLSRVFREQMLDGMIVVAGIPDPAIQRVKELIPRCVFLDTNVWEETGCVCRDEIHTGRTVAQKVIELGYRRLVIASPYQNQDRREGVRQIVRDQGGVCLEEVSLPDHLKSPDPGLLKRILTPDTVVITCEDQFAARIIGWASLMGLCVGKDYSLASCDRSHNVRMMLPGLSCVSYERMEFGRRAGKMLFDEIQGNEESCRSIKIRSEWFAGNTACGPRNTVWEK